MNPDERFFAFLRFLYSQPHFHSCTKISSFLSFFLYTSFIFLFPISFFFHFVCVIDLFCVRRMCLAVGRHGKTNQGNCIFLFGLQEDPGQRGNDFNIKLDNCTDLYITRSWEIVSCWGKFIIRGRQIFLMRSEYRSFRKGSFCGGYRKSRERVNEIVSL
jgi:hypothetical protein